MRPEASEQDYAAAAAAAFERGDARLALEQIGAALSFAPHASEHLALLDLVLSRVSRPLDLLPDERGAFFGGAAVRAYVLARSGQLARAIWLLFEVASFRPQVGYLGWLEEWSSGDLRGVDAARVCAAVARYVSDRAAAVVPENLRGCAALLRSLRAARPKAARDLAKVEAAVLARGGWYEQALQALVACAGEADDPEWLAQRAALERKVGRLERAHESLARALELAPGRPHLQADLADTLLAMGRLEQAQSHYRDVATGASDGLRTHGEDGVRYIAWLCDPSGPALSPPGSSALTIREVFPLWALYRTHPPPAAEHELVVLLRSVLRNAALRGTPPGARVVARVAHPPSRSLELAFDAGMRALGGRGVIAHPHTPAATLSEPEALDSATRRRIFALASTEMDIDRWCAGDDALAQAEAEMAFLNPFEAGSDPFETMDRARLATLALALRALEPHAATARWVLALAGSGDEWESRPAVTVLAAKARADARWSVPVRDALERCLYDHPEAAHVHGALAVLPGLSVDVRGRHYAAFVAWLCRPPEQ